MIKIKEKPERNIHMEISKEIEKVIAQGPYTDTWASLAEYRAPRWFSDAKFGIFIHWGVYSVPAFANEWYSRNMYIQGTREFEHHVATYGPQKEFGYKDFIPMFRAEKFDADAWAEFFAEAGARYVVPVAEHHDGFQMYPSKLSHWNAGEMGPCRDVIGEVLGACAKKGMTPGTSTHRVEHWFFMGHGREFDSDIHEPMKRGDFYWPAMPEGNHHDLYSTPVPTDEFLEDWLERCCELVDLYHPKLVYFDWWIQHSAVRPYLRKFAAYYYNRAAEWGEEVVITYKHDAFQFGAAVPDVERGQFAQAKPYVWQSDTAIARNSWCYTENNEFKKPESIIRDLADIVSKNGNLLLNVGPKSDGTISEEDQKVLRGIGQWMKVNGEAIYDTRVWRYSAEGPTAIPEGQFTDGAEKVFTPEDFRFTVKGDKIYAICMQWPENGEVNIRSFAVADASHLPVFAGIIRDVEILGEAEKPEWTRDEQGLHVCAKGVKSEYPVVIALTVE